MGHDHDHDHDHHHHHDPQTYYLEQLFTIGACGALAAVALLWWGTPVFNLVLAKQYHLLALFGGLLLLTMVVIRAVALWRFVGDPPVVPAHDHGHEHSHDHADHHHEHGPDCDHHHEPVGAAAHHDAFGEAPSEGIRSSSEVGGVATAPVASPALPHSHNHGHSHAPDHDHGHDHDHGWAPWRFVVLLLPVALFFLGLPNQGFSAGQAVEVAEPTGSGVDKKQEDFNVTFLQLENAAVSPESRDFYEGKTVKLTGRYTPRNDRSFTLTRYKMQCCAADAVPLNAAIMIDPASKQRLDSAAYGNKWVRVTGRVQFVRPVGKDAFIPALILSPTKEHKLSAIVEVINPDPKDFYAN